MTATIAVQAPVVIGSRRIYPVVAQSMETIGPGFVSSVRPLALIIEESGRYSIALIEGESVQGLLAGLGIPASD
jgi:hypothetical protein